MSVKILTEGFNSKYFNILKEDVIKQITSILSNLNEAEMSDEDREESRILRQILSKASEASYDRRKALKYTPRELEVADKYNLTLPAKVKKWDGTTITSLTDKDVDTPRGTGRDRYTPSLSRDIEKAGIKNRRDANIANFVRSRKEKGPRDERPYSQVDKFARNDNTDVFGDTTFTHDKSGRFGQDSWDKEHGRAPTLAGGNRRTPSGRWIRDKEKDLTDVEKDRIAVNKQMSQPVKDMKKALADRSENQRDLDNVNLNYARNVADARRRFDDAMAYADEQKQKESERGQKGVADANNRINKLLKKESLEGSDAKERQEKLYNGMLGYLVELISDPSELVDTLRRIGFTDDEIRSELDWVSDEDLIMSESFQKALKEKLDSLNEEGLEKIDNSVEKKINDIKLEPGKNVEFEDGDYSVWFTWHEPGINTNWYPIVQIDKGDETIYHREGGENPDSWGGFVKKAADAIKNPPAKPFLKRLYRIADRYSTSRPVSGDWDTETVHEQRAIAKGLGISMKEAKQVMINQLGFTEDMFVESFSVRLRNKISSLNEAEMSDEDKHDTDILKNIYRKTQSRANAALTPEEKSVLQKYNLERVPWDKNIHGRKNFNGREVQGSAIFQRGDFDKKWNRNKFQYDDPKSDKINYADRARKRPARDEQQDDLRDRDYWDMPTPDYAARHERDADDEWNPLTDHTYQKAERHSENQKMTQNVRDMKRALRDRKASQAKVDSADADLQAQLDKLKAEYEDRIAGVKKSHESRTDYSRKDVERNQKQINRLLRREDN